MYIRAFLYVYVYIYTHIYTHICIYMYVYIHICVCMQSSFLLFPTICLCANHTRQPTIPQVQCIFSSLLAFAHACLDCPSSYMIIFYLCSVSKLLCEASLDHSFSIHCVALCSQVELISESCFPLLQNGLEYCVQNGFSHCNSALY